MNNYTNHFNNFTWWEINSAKPKSAGNYEVHCKDGKTYTVPYTGDCWDTTYLKSEMVCFLAKYVVLKSQPYLTSWEELQ